MMEQRRGLHLGDFYGSRSLSWRTAPSNDAGNGPLVARLIPMLSERSLNPIIHEIGLKMMPVKALYVSMLGWLCLSCGTGPGAASSTPAAKTPVADGERYFPL